LARGKLACQSRQMKKTINAEGIVRALDKLPPAMSERSEDNQSEQKSV